MNTSQSTEQFIKPDYLLIVRLSMLFCMACFAITLGLTYPLLALILEKQGYNEASIGISAAMAPLGILLSSALVPRFTRRIGVSTCMILGLLASAICLFLLYAWQNYYAWLGFRLLLGIAINVSFIIGEAWVNETAKEKHRAKTISIYMTVLALAFCVGPLVISLVGVKGFVPFAIGIALPIMAVIPVIYYRKCYPDFPQGKHAVSIWDFIPQAPALLFAVLMVTTMDQSMLSLLSLYGLAKGLPQSQAVLLVTYLVLGTVILQFPIGMLADRLANRRLATFGCAVLATLGFALIPFSMDSAWIYVPLITFSGGIGFAIYTLSMIELGQRFSGALLLSGTACFSLIWGIGGLTAPPIAGFLMENTISDSFMYLSAGGFLLLAVLMWIRRNRANITSAPHQHEKIDKREKSF